MNASLVAYPTVHEALLYEKLPRNKVTCGLCERRCTIGEGERGFCRTRANIEGKLYTLVYGDISAVESRPIEIKPFFHYWPGSTALTLSTWSCNFGCPWCQNFHLSKLEPDPLSASFYSEEKAIDLALNREDDGVCISFQEPTLLFEWAVSLFEKSHKRGMYGCYVSNGYMTSEALEMLQNAGMDGLKIDIKGDAETYRKYCGDVDVDKVWRNAGEAKKRGLHVEIVSLIISDVSDDEACIKGVINRHLKEVGAETPLHFIRYYPAYKFNNPPTKIETLENAYDMAKDAGIQYPYVGNVLGHKYESTYCPNCSGTLIQRFGHSIRKYNVTMEKKCPKCGQSIPIRGNFIMNWW